ncbi:DnaD domain protein [Acetilactobacillus jinshanensis]|uniref:DnaD domain protein n=1 Tax=Acetilactobacillus jinshanensis TaxID=1720083 RepID=A0A4V1ALR8_9LACO|nr:DnaD domain protein [Acetilactobacillus jinshanensis]QBP18549.1 DnaD domain protein [Acetilactobacillus jinshanensis]URL61423.1 DnaD domain protein [uncultured bacterium]
MDSFALKLIENGQTTISNYLLSNFTKLNMNPNELVMYLQIKRYSDEGIKFPDVNSLIKSTGFSKNQVYEILHKLIQKKLMTINTTQDEDHHETDAYDFSLMYQKLDQLSHSNQDNNENWSLNNISRTNTNSVTVSARDQVFRTIAKEFGRDLSPMEAQTIDGWMTDDHYSPKMIVLALREAVLSQVYNLRYIDRILNSWENRNIRTPQALQNAINQEKNQHRLNNHPTNDQKGPDIPIFKI